MKFCYLKTLFVAFCAFATTSLWADEFTLTYCNGQLGTGLGLRNSSYGTLEFGGAACFSSAKLTNFVGSKVIRLRYGFQSVSNVSSLKLWIRSTLAGKDLVSITATEYKDGWNEFTLPSPYVIPANTTLYVGFTYVQPASTDTYMITVCGGTGSNGTTYAKVPDGWQDIYKLYNYGNICIEAVLETPELPEYRVALNNVATEQASYYVGDAIKINGMIENTSRTEMTDCDIQFSAPGVEPFTKHFTSAIKSGESCTFSTTFTPTYNDPHANDTITAQVVKINGLDMTDSLFTAQCPLTVYKTRYDRNVVIEEGTGTWCGFCIRGFVAMEEMEKKGDSFIGIGVHYNDAMAVTSYSTKLGLESYPGCNVDRTYFGQNVSTESFQSFYTTQRALGTYVDFDFEANLSERIITAKSTASWDFTKSNVDYRMVYVLTEDSVTGYAQANNFAGGALGEMGGYEKLPNPVPAGTMVFNEVARGIYPTYLGNKGSLTKNAVAGETYTHTQTIKVPNTITNAKLQNITVIALLIDGATGKICQGKKLHYKDITTGIEDSLTLDQQPAATSNPIYSLTGQCVKKPRKGNIYIIGGKKVLY